MSCVMENTVIYLIGYPGVGKYTIAKEIAKKANFIIADNQLINSPIFSVVGADGKSSLPAGTWDAIGKIRNIVLHVIEHIAPKHLNYVLTNALMNTDADRKVYDNILHVFERRGSRIFPVLLTCEIDEHKRRIVGEGRSDRFKSIHPDNVDKCTAQGLMPLSGPDVLNIDVSNMSAEQVADFILKEVEQRLIFRPEQHIQRSPT